MLLFKEFMETGEETKISSYVCSLIPRASEYMDPWFLGPEQSVWFDSCNSSKHLMEVLSGSSTKGSQKKPPRSWLVHWSYFWYTVHKDRYLALKQEMINLNYYFSSTYLSDNFRTANYWISFVDLTFFYFYHTKDICADYLEVHRSNPTKSIIEFIIGVKQQAQYIVQFEIWSCQCNLIS